MSYCKITCETFFTPAFPRSCKPYVALDRAMIPLGSCTMKLNATMEMEPILQPLGTGIHPLAPLV